MTEIDEVLANNTSYAANFRAGDLPVAPGRKLAVVACADARMDVHRILVLEEGDAHVIRNAGGVITDDVIRSLMISQRLLGTREVMLIHHTDRGMLKFRDDDFKDAIESETGLRPAFALEAFCKSGAGRAAVHVARINASPFIPHKERSSGIHLRLRPPES